MTALIKALDKYTQDFTPSKTAEDLATCEYIHSTVTEISRLADKICEDSRVTVVSSVDWRIIGNLYKDTLVGKGRIGDAQVDSILKDTPILLVDLKVIRDTLK
jgi:hypothetical protein